MAKPILHTRRNLLKLFGSLPLVSLLPTSSLAENLQVLGRQTGRRRLIILELFGGNDALNTLIPYRDPLYRRYRPNLAISPKDWISLNDEQAFNPSFKSLAELYQRGELAVIPDAGYPNPSLSHFDSTAIWNTGYLDTTLRSGWTGRTIAANRSWAAPHDANGIVFSGSPTFLQEEGVRMLELQDTSALMSSDDVALRPAVQAPNSATHYIRSLIENHRDISQRIRQKLNRPNPFERLFRSSEYGYLEPIYVQGAQLLWLIACDVDTPVFKLGMSGFDLHSLMNELHRPLLHQVATLLALPELWRQTTLSSARKGQIIASLFWHYSQLLILFLFPSLLSVLGAMGAESFVPTSLGETARYVAAGGLLWLWCGVLWLSRIYSINTPTGVRLHSIAISIMGLVINLIMLVNISNHPAAGSFLLLAPLLVLLLSSSGNLNSLWRVAVFYVPSLSFFHFYLTSYSVANFSDISWGTKGLTQQTRPPQSGAWSRQRDMLLCAWVGCNTVLAFSMLALGQQVYTAFVSIFILFTLARYLCAALCSRLAGRTRLFCARRFPSTRQPQ
ncbi:DUF1501 domain-containing protein [Dickeya dadantii subsp. dieffenbachiae]|uniref:DUF1501 domain-containing protein n=1 Tax=Dickeya dadantii TaxID=204038 RepID=UPI0003A4E809|nr:hypothetical protein [Dickeya dadantii]